MNNSTPKNRARLRALLGTLLLTAATQTAQGALPPKVTTLPAITGAFSTPLRIAADSAGYYYLSDPRGGGILKYDQSWKLVQTLSTTDRPLGMAFSPQGSLLVTHGDHVSIINSSGSQTGMLGSGYGQFKLASGIAVDDHGNIYVTDSLANCVQVFNPSGGFSFRFGTKGSDPGQFSSPAGITFEKSARQMAVADTLNGRIQFFDLNGVFQKAIGSLGSGPLKFTAPQAVAFEYADSGSQILARMYVVDSFHSTVQVINPGGAGTFLGYIGSYGTSAGKLVNPSDLLFERTTGKLLVVNSLAGSLSQFAINNATSATALQFSVSSPPSIVSTPSIVLTGTAASGTIIRATSDNGVLFGAASYPTATTWSVPVNQLQPGVNQLTVVAESSSGEFASQVVSVSYVTSAPTITMNPVAQLINVPHVVVSGTRRSTDTISISTNSNGVAGPINYLSATTWETTITNLSPGENIITVMASNGSATSATTAAVTLDITPPATTVARLPEATYVADPVYTVSGITYDDNIDRVTINGTPAVLLGSVFSGAVVLAGGPNTIEVTSYDKAGNSTTATHTVIFTTATPPVQVTSPSEMYLTKNNNYTIQGQSDAGYVVTVNGSPAIQNGTEWTASVSLSPGINTVSIVATDTAGKSHAVKRTIINSPGPEISVTGPSQDVAVKTASLPVSGTAEPGSTISYTVNGKTTSLGTVTGSGTFNFTIPLSAEGVYPIVVTATGVSGATNSVVRNVFYDASPPAVSVDLTKAWSTRSVSGTTESGAVVTAEVGGTVIGKTVAVSGAWSFDLSQVSYTKENLLVRTRDAAGNIRVRSLYPTGAVVTGGGEPQIIDALKLMRVTAGYDKPSQEDLLQGDIAPLKDGRPNPNGIIDAHDVILSLRRIVGLISW